MSPNKTGNLLWARIPHRLGVACLLVLGLGVHAPAQSPVRVKGAYIYNLVAYTQIMTWPGTYLCKQCHTPLRI